MSALASEVCNTRLLTGDAVAATIAHEVKQPLSGIITLFSQVTFCCGMTP